MACGSGQGNVCERLSNPNICIYKTNSRFLYRLLYMLYKYSVFMLCMIYNLHCFGSSFGPLSVLCELIRVSDLLQLRSFHLRKLQRRPVFICDLLRCLVWYAVLLCCLHWCCLRHSISCLCDKNQVGICAGLVVQSIDCTILADIEPFFNRGAM